MNGIRPLPLELPNCERKKRNYKLLVDPALKKGPEKIYRYDGIVPGHENLYPPVQVRDPRSRLAVLWAKSEPADLLVPRFSIDKNYVGIPPPMQVTIMNLNDNVNKQFLDDMLKKFGPVEQACIFYHPKTKKHLRIAHITFMKCQSAKQCIEKLNNTAVMGDILSVFLDPFGHECNRMFDHAVAGHSEFDGMGRDLNFPMGDPRIKMLPMDKKMLGVPDMHGKKMMGEFNYVHSVDHSTPSSSDLGYCSESVQSNNKLSEKSFAGSHSDVSSFLVTPVPPYGHHPASVPPLCPPSKPWEWSETNNISPALEGHSVGAVPPQPQPFQAKPSPFRESLDSRIELLLKQGEARNSFLGLDTKNDMKNYHYQKNDHRNSESLREDMPPLPPDSSPLPPLPECDEMPPPPPNEDVTFDLLSTPPSPFLSVQEYQKWAVVTRDVDNGKFTSLSDALTRDAAKDGDLNVQLTNLDLSKSDSGNLVDLSAHFGSPVLCKGDSTPVRDEPLDNIFLTMHKRDSLDDDDKMSLSSLSSGEDKLEINIPHTDNSISADSKSYLSTSRTGFSSAYPTANLSPSIYGKTTSYRPPTPLFQSFPPVPGSYPMFPTSSSSQTMFPPPAGTSAPPPHIPPPLPPSAMHIPPPPIAAGHPPTSHPMYPSEKVQMMARMGIWRPGMGSDMSHSPVASPTKFGGVPTPPIFAPPPPGASFYPRPPPAFPAMPFENMLSRPPPGYPYYPPGSKIMPPMHPFYSLRYSSPEKLRNASVINNVLDSVVKELKQVMKKDLCKRMVEVFAFKYLEQWFEDRQRQTKVKPEGGTPTTSTGPSLVDSLTSLFDTSNNSSYRMGLDGFGLGLRASMPRMPSFRRKIIKNPSPVPLDDEDSKKAEDSDGEKVKSDSEGETATPRPRRAVFSSDDDQSSLDSDSEKDESGSESSSEASSESGSSYESESESESEEVEEAPAVEKVVEELEEAPAVEKVVEELEEGEIASDSEQEEPTKSVPSKAKPMKLAEIIEQEDKLAAEQMELSAISPQKSAEDITTKELEVHHEDSTVEISEEPKVRREPKKRRGRYKKSAPKEQIVPEDSRAIEASQALMELASSFMDFGNQGLNKEPLPVEDQLLQNDSEEHKMDTPDIEKDHIMDEPVPSPETTMSADEIPTLDDDGSDFERDDIFVEQEDNANLLMADHSYCLPFDPRKKKDLKDVPPVDHVSTKSQEIKKPIASAELVLTPVVQLEDLIITKPRKARTKRKYSSLLPPHEIKQETEDWKKPIFSKRSLIEEMNILYEFLKAGIDSEDVQFMQMSYNALLQDDTQGYWLNDTHWVDHPPHIPSPVKKKRKDEKTKETMTGCSRCDGYSKTAAKDKNKVYHSVIAGSNAEDVSETMYRAKMTAQQSSREARSNQRRLLTSYADADFTSDLLKFNQLKFRKKQLKFARSRIHDWGLFALEPIAADEMVIEYVGQMVRNTVADTREKKYQSIGVGSSYLFKIDHDMVIDATRCGNLARFINHSCNPNCYAKIITVEGLKKIVIYSKQIINVNEEITYDYKFPIEEEKISCLCGAPQCRHFLN